MDSHFQSSKRYQVFVSSTYLDLVEERKAVIQALLELDCFPAGMEMFPAADEDQWTLIKGVIDLSDFYVVILGGRYGSLDEEGVSFTEKEYDYAVSKEIPVLGFVHSDPAVIPAGKTETSEESRAKLDAFRAKVKKRMVKEYTTPGDLTSVVSRGLIRAIKGYDRPGWVRGDQAMSPQARVEMAELRTALAVAEMRSTVATQQVEEREIDESFEHGSDVIELIFDAEDPFSDFNTRVNLPISWDGVVECLGPSMLDDLPEHRMQDLLNTLGRDRYKSGGGGSEMIMGSSQIRVGDLIRILAGW